MCEALLSFFSRSFWIRKSGGEIFYLVKCSNNLNQTKDADLWFDYELSITSIQ